MHKGGCVGNEYIASCGFNTTFTACIILYLYFMGKNSLLCKIEHSNKGVQAMVNLKIIIWRIKQHGNLDGSDNGIQARRGHWDKGRKQVLLQH